ncbi:IS3 family transposase [Carnobacterium divergens]|uniref:IS3 family transposase n=1 Tax=Carnobacterium divergens TaxID=2748 RepID=UPI001EE317E0|nr:IS3 family transposase [Carnobacterium divergens]
MELVHSFKDKVSITWLCDYFSIPRSTYYHWAKRSDKKDSRVARIKELCNEHNYTYGYRKITFLLRKEMQVNHKVVQRIMQTYGWNCRVKIKKAHRPGSAYFKTSNLIDRKFHSKKPLEKITTDITYLDYGPKRLYLSSIMDLFNGEILSYTISDKQDIACVLDTLNQLKNLPENCILHSDQGSVYTSYAYEENAEEEKDNYQFPGFFSEVDWLKIQHFEQLREIYDENNLALILVGMPGIEKRLSRYPQLYSRIGSAHEFSALSKDETHHILEFKWEELGLPVKMEDFSDYKAVTKIIKITNGNFRLIQRLFTQIDRIVEINNLTTITVEVVEVARDSLVIGIK